MVIIGDWVLVFDVDERLNILVKDGIEKAIVMDNVLVVNLMCYELGSN